MVWSQPVPEAVILPTVLTYHWYQLYTMDYIILCCNGEYLPPSSYSLGIYTCWSKPVHHHHSNIISEHYSVTFLALSDWQSLAMCSFTLTLGSTPLLVGTG